MIFSYNFSTKSTYVSSTQAFIQDFGPGGVGAEPREGIVRSRSKLITARGSGGAL